MMIPVENWQPKTGDVIEVRNAGEWTKRIFLCMWKGKYLCVQAGHKKEDDPCTVPWNEAQPLPNPKYRPYTMKEFVAEWVKRGMPNIYDEKVILISPTMITLKDRYLVSYDLMLNRSKLKLLSWSNGDIMGVEDVS